MGFYIKDLYVQRVPKFVWHDPLTNPPTVPETSPIINVAALTPKIAVARGNGGGAELPADDQTLVDVPTWLTPIITPQSRLDERDLLSVRESLIATLKVVEQQISAMEPTAEDLEHVATVIRG